MQCHLFMMLIVGKSGHGQVSVDTVSEVSVPFSYTKKIPADVLEQSNPSRLLGLEIN